MKRDFIKYCKMKIMNGGINTFEVTDRKSFAQFLELMRLDLVHNQEEWENITLHDFLEAMSDYTEGIQDYYDNTHQNVNAETADWKTFSDIMRGARIYE